MTAPQDTTQIALPGAQCGHALIIEDDELIAASIEAEVRDLGFGSVGVAKNESEAVIFASQQEPQLITVDARLEEGNGVDAVLAICAERALPVIVVTGNPFQVTLPGVVTLGKPFSSAAFRAAYEQAMSRPFSAASTQ